MRLHHVDHRLDASLFNCLVLCARCHQAEHTRRRNARPAWEKWHCPGASVLGTIWVAVRAVLPTLWKLGHRSFHQREMLSQTPSLPFGAGKSAGGGAEVAAVVVAAGWGDEAGAGAEVAAVDDADDGGKASAVVVAGGGDEAGGVAKTAAVLVAAGGGDEACRGAEVAAVVFAGFAFARAAGGFTAAGANGSSSAMTGSGVMTVFEAVPASPDCMELDWFTAMRTGTLCGW
jgi:hypothetical protein